MDNPVSQTPYGYAYFMTDYNLVQYITIALDGQNIGQPLFRYADPTNYVKVYVNSWAAYTANPVLTYQYNSTYWPTELNAPDPFSCATVSVSLRNVCNPATSVYFPSASTLAPVSQGGNYGCLCTNGMGQGAAACPTLDLSQPGTVVAIAVIAAVGNYTNLAAGCGNSVGTIVMGMYAQQYIVPNCYVPRPPASPPPPPSPPPPSPPTPPPGPSPPPLPPPTPPLPPSPFPPPGPPQPPSPPSTDLTSVVTFTSFSKVFDQQTDCIILNSALQYYTAGRNWATSCTTGVTTSATGSQSTIQYTIFTTDPTGMTGMTYIYLSISNPNSNWWTQVALALNIGCSGTGAYRDNASILVPSPYNPPHNNNFCASGRSPADGCAYNLGPQFVCPSPPPSPPLPPSPPSPSPPNPPPTPPAPSPPSPPPPSPPSPSPPLAPPPSPPAPPPPCIVFVTMRNPVNPNFPANTCTTLPLYLNGFYLSNVSTILPFACSSAIGPIEVTMASQMRTPADAVKFMNNFNNSISGSSYALLVVSIYMPPGLCGISYTADATMCGAGTYSWNNGNLPALPTSCPPPPPVPPPPPPPPFPRPPLPPAPPSPPNPPPHPQLPTFPPSPPPPTPPPPPMQIQLYMGIASQVPFPVSDGSVARYQCGQGATWNQLGHRITGIAAVCNDS